MDDSPTSCCGPGKPCCNSTPARTLNRRQFIQTTAIAAGGLGLIAGETGAEVPSETEGEVLAHWKRAVHERGGRRVYGGDELQHIAIPLGGIGAGQVYLRGDGTLGPWQILNNFNSGAFAPGSLFAIHTRTADGTVTARLLQQGDDNEIPGVTDIELSGEHPLAWLKYVDDALPVDVTLEAYSPFCPLNSKDSGLPAAVFRFTIRNPGDTPVDVALLGAAPNLVGWDGYGRLDTFEHDDFIGNQNVVHSRDALTFAHMATAPMGGHQFGAPRTVVTNSRTVAYAMRHCENATVVYRATPPVPTDNGNTVVWLGDGADALGDAGLHEVLDAVQGGGSLIVRG